MSEKNEKNSFKPYMSPHENPPEFTVTSTVMGILLAILAVLGLTDKMNLSSVVSGGTIGGLALLIVLTALVFGAAGKSKK